MHPPVIKTLLISTNHVLFTGLHVALSPATETLLAYDSSAALRIIHEARPGVLILDMDFPGNALALIREFQVTSPEAKILVLAGLKELDLARQAFTIGVHGIVLKTQPLEVLRQAVTALLPPRVGADPAAIRESSGPRRVLGPVSLTPREREIVQLVSQGYSNKEIGARMSISTITVRHHLTSIFDKVGTSDRQKLVIQALNQGIGEHGKQNAT
ncbi:MAG: response regulator transcription factor [Nitrospiraceae bacterium]